MGSDRDLLFEQYSDYDFLKEQYRNGTLQGLDDYERELLEFCHDRDMREYLRENVWDKPIVLNSEGGVDWGKTKYQRGGQRHVIPEQQYYQPQQPRPTYQPIPQQPIMPQVTEQRFYYLYDDDGNLIKTERFVDDVKVVEAVYSYDKDDRLIEMAATSVLSGNTQKRYDYEYDSEGKLLRFWMDPGTGDSLYRTEHVYNDLGQIVEINTYAEYDSGEVFWIQHHTREYDADGNVIKEENYNIRIYSTFIFRNLNFTCDLS